MAPESQTDGRYPWKKNYQEEKREQHGSASDQEEFRLRGVYYSRLVVRQC